MSHSIQPHANTTAALTPLQLSLNSLTLSPHRYCPSLECVLAAVTEGESSLLKLYNIDDLPHSLWSQTTHPLPSSLQLCHGVPHKGSESWVSERCQCVAVLTRR